MWGDQGLLTVLNKINRERTFPSLEDIKSLFFETVEMPLKDDLTMLYVTYKEEINKELPQSYMNPDEYIEELGG